MLLKMCFGITACILIAGCTSDWIENPSASTRNLVNDLRLEGYDCKARTSDIECLQVDPLRHAQAAICDSRQGCKDQLDILVYNRYLIDQPASGVPGIQLNMVEKTESADIHNLVRDLRLKGFECETWSSNTECVQTEPQHQKQPAKCASDQSCIDQPDKLTYDRYRIDQPYSGTPNIKIDKVEKVGSKLLSIPAPPSTELNR